MLDNGEIVFLQLEGQNLENGLTPAKVIENTGDRSIAIMTEEPVQPRVGEPLDIYFTNDRQFARAKAMVTAWLQSQPTIIFRADMASDIQKCDGRNAFRVSAAASNLTIKLDDRWVGVIADASVNGLGVIAPDQFKVGQSVKVELVYADNRYTGEMTICGVRARKDGRCRYGMIVPDSAITLRKGLQRLSTDLQRAQLRRMLTRA